MTLDAPVSPLDAMSRMDARETSPQFMFRCSDAWYAVPATQVRELSIAPEIVPVPGCHGCIEGLCRQQSEFVPVIALDALLDGQISTASKANRQLLTLSGTSIWAIRIAEAAGLENLETIVSQESNGGIHASRGVVGTATWGDKFVRVLNPEQLYRQAHQDLEAGWSVANAAVRPSNPEQGDSI